MKHSLRQHYENARTTLSPEQREKFSLAAADHFFTAFSSTLPKILGGYHAMRQECEPLPLLTRAADRGITLCLPAIREETRTLEFRQWSPGAPLQRGKHRTHEPLNTAHALSPDMLLVPGLAFTKEGFRLGYGGGYYDHTLATLRANNPTLRTVGLCFDLQITDSLPLEPHDTSLDYLLTETALIHTRAP